MWQVRAEGREGGRGEMDEMGREVMGCYLAIRSVSIVLRRRLWYSSCNYYLIRQPPKPCPYDVCSHHIEIDLLNPIFGVDFVVFRNDPRLMERGGVFRSSMVGGSGRRELMC